MTLSKSSTSSTSLCNWETRAASSLYVWVRFRIPSLPLDRASVIRMCWRATVSIRRRSSVEEAWERREFASSRERDAYPIAARMVCLTLCTF